MARLLVVLGGVILAFTIFSLIDLAMTEKNRVRALNKPLWVLLILVLPAIGGILWLVLGKTRGGGAPAKSMAPDDDPTFLSGLGRDREQDERIRRLEQELSELDDDTKPE